jgi:hypothetical protein
MGVDAEWDFQRIVSVGRIAKEKGVRWITVDFNCRVHDPQYVNDVLDRLLVEDPDLFAMLAYVEQPFPYDLEKHRIDVHSVSQRKPLFMDEAPTVHRLGRQLGLTGVALKTCKTQTGALLSLCWAKAHNMQVMVQDLTNPMLAQIPHVLLAAYAETTMGVETNAMQFYPKASSDEARVHPGLYQRHAGMVDLSIAARASGIARRNRPAVPEPVVRWAVCHWHPASVTRRASRHDNWAGCTAGSFGVRRSLVEGPCTSFTGGTPVANLGPEHERARSEPDATPQKRSFFRAEPQ